LGAWLGAKAMAAAKRAKRVTIWKDFMVAITIKINKLQQIEFEVSRLLYSR
jgi:hypothetical protein